MSAQSQTIYRYVYPHQNRKNDSQIKPSPYASGYYNYKPIEFSYEPVPTESMKEKAKRVLDSLPVAQEESEEEDIEKILGGMNFDSFSFGEQSTIIKELEEEAKTAIAKQETEAEKALLAKRKTNVASYAASVEAKKQRDKEAELAAQNPESPEQQPENPWGEWGEWSEEESDSSGSVEITYGKDGKIKIKAPSSNNNQPPTPAPIASATIKP
jgi:hypothetical protein